jgi:hypothetical protein
MTAKELLVPSDEVNRRLAVIVAAHVTAYSRLMFDDEEATLGTLATYQEVIAGLVAEHQGRIFGMAGDSVMIEFASAVQAVRCAPLPSNECLTGACQVRFAVSPTSQQHQDPAGSDLPHHPQRSIVEQPPAGHRRAL